MSSLAWLVANRFAGSKNKTGFISFVSSSSTIGIGLGCFVLIVLLSVMNGFERELRESLLAYVPHAELIDASNEGIKVDANWTLSLMEDNRIKHIFELNKASGLLQKANKMKAVELIGIDETYANAKLSQQLDFSSLNTTNNSIVLGKDIMRQLSLSIGDNIQLLLPNITSDLSFKAPKVFILSVVGEVSLGGDIDSFIGIMDRNVMASMLSYDDRVTAIELMLYDPFQSYQLVREYGYGFNQQVYMSDWTRTHGHLYQDIQLVRTVVYIALALVICVACFNIVSSLVMLVKEKTAEIAILKTMGANDRLIKQIFIYQGMLNGLKGASIGTVLGVLCAVNVPNIIQFIERVFGFDVLGGGVYFVASLPSQLIWSDVIVTYLIALVLCVIATLYPANRAAKIDPATTLI